MFNLAQDEGAATSVETWYKNHLPISSSSLHGNMGRSFCFPFATSKIIIARLRKAVFEVSISQTNIITTVLPRIKNSLEISSQGDLMTPSKKLPKPSELQISYLLNGGGEFISQSHNRIRWDKQPNHRAGAGAGHTRGSRRSPLTIPGGKWERWFPEESFIPPWKISTLP